MLPTFLFVIACSASNPTDTAATNADVPSCVTGLGEPDESSLERTLDPAWMAENYGYSAHVECLGFPKLRIGSDEDGAWPISYLLLNVASYDNGPWVEELGSTLTIAMDGEEIGDFEPVDEYCTLGYCGPAWMVDLTELDVVVSPDDERFIDFTLAAFDDPSEIDELWDETEDDILIYAEVGHSWSEVDGDTVIYSGYMAGTTVTMHASVQY